MKSVVSKKVKGQLAAAQTAIKQLQDFFSNDVTAHVVKMNVTIVAGLYTKSTTKKFQPPKYRRSIIIELSCPDGVVFGN